MVVTPYSPGKPAGERRDLSLQLLRRRRERHKTKQKTGGARNSANLETKRPGILRNRSIREKHVSYLHGYRGALIMVHVSPHGRIRACKGCATAPAAVAQAMVRGRAIHRGGVCVERRCRCHTFSGTWGVGGVRHFSSVTNLLATAQLLRALRERRRLVHSKLGRAVSPPPSYSTTLYCRAGKEDMRV